MEIRIFCVADCNKFKKTYQVGKEVECVYVRATDDQMRTWMYHKGKMILVATVRDDETGHKIMTTEQFEAWRQGVINDSKTPEGSITDGRDLKAGELVNWKGAVCEFMGTRDGGNWLVLKMKGGGRVPVSLEAGEVVTRSTAKKKTLPDWMKRGTIISDDRTGREYIIESVGNCNVSLHNDTEVQLSFIMLHYTESTQPLLPVWMKTGGTCTTDGGRKAEILSVEGCMAKVRIDYGCGVTCDADRSYCELSL